MPAKIAFHSAFASVLSALFLAVILVGESRAAAVESKPEVEIEKLTWVEVHDRLANGTTTILIPTGGTEQNGPHMALGKHNFIVRETTRRIALELGDALVAPVMAYVPEGQPDVKSGHMAYPGTISLPQDVFEKVLENTAISFKTHGFKQIVFVGDSGGNQAAQKSVAEKLTQKWKRDGVQVMTAAAYYANNNGDAFLESQGLTNTQIGTHAGVRDTSELMFVAPWAVDQAKAGADAKGATGDARLAKAQWGKRLIAGKVKAAVDEIRAARKQVSAAKTAATGFFSWLFALITG